MSQRSVLAGPGSAVLRCASGRAARGGAVVLGYHDVVATDGEAEGLTVSAPGLRRHLALVRRMGFVFVSALDLTERIVARHPVDGLAALVFDDALAGVTRHGLEVLHEEQVPASLAVVSTAMGQRPTWWPGSGPTMSRRELLAAFDAGLDVIAHTRTHASLPNADDAGLRRELEGSKADLEDLFGRAVDVVAYPFGHHDPRVRAASAEAGYLAAYTFLNGRIRGSEDPFRLPRFTMGSHHHRARLAYHLARSPASWPEHQYDVVTDHGRGDASGPGTNRG